MTGYFVLFLFFSCQNNSHTSMKHFLNSLFLHLLFTYMQNRWCSTKMPFCSRNIISQVWSAVSSRTCFIRSAHGFIRDLYFNVLWPSLFRGKVWSRNVCEMCIYVFIRQDCSSSYPSPILEHSVLSGKLIEVDVTSDRHSPHLGNRITEFTLRILSGWNFVIMMISFFSHYSLGKAMGEYNVIKALQLKLIEKNEAKYCGCLETCTSFAPILSVLCHWMINEHAVFVYCRKLRQ